MTKLSNESTQPSKSILIIDDDVELCDLLTQLLESENYHVTCRHDGDSGLVLAKSGLHFDLILLDVMLPKRDGYEVLKSLRVTHVTPVIMLTAKGQAFDKIFGLEIGADDHIAKPFDSRELIARIKALLRRLKYGANTGTQSQLFNGPMRIDCNTGIAYYNSSPLTLTNTEFMILQLLCSNLGIVVSKENLSQYVFGRGLQAYDRSIDMHMSNLRKKLKDCEAGGCIRTIRGSGYSMAKI